MSHGVDDNRTPSIPVYAIPDKSKKKKLPENVEHKSGPDQQNKSKGVIVNKKAKRKKEALENIELVHQIQFCC